MAVKKDAGLILEGGANRGIFTTGALDYLMEQEYEFPYVIGVSMGSCNGGSYVAKQPGRMKKCMLHDTEHGNTRYVKNMIQKHSLFDMDMVFDTFPREIYPFDHETYFASEQKMELVVTNCLTGEAEYLSEKEDPERLMLLTRASCSMPIVSPAVMIDGVPYLDGGVADSVPILHAIHNGCKKNVLILTRAKGYRKKPMGKSRALYQQALKEYPEVYRALMKRHHVYNKTMDYIEKWEDEGKVFVLRPSIPTISRTETNEEKLMEFYQHGYDTMKEQFEAMKEFIGE